MNKWLSSILCVYLSFCSNSSYQIRGAGYTKALSVQDKLRRIHLLWETKDCVSLCPALPLFCFVRYMRVMTFIFEGFFTFSIVGWNRLILILWKKKIDYSSIVIFWDNAQDKLKSQMFFKCVEENTRFEVDFWRKKFFCMSRRRKSWIVTFHRIV